jgi:hypothetical protein
VDLATEQFSSGDRGVFERSYVPTFAYLQYSVAGEKFKHIELVLLLAGGTVDESVMKLHTGMMFNALKDIYIIHEILYIEYYH